MQRLSFFRRSVSTIIKPPASLTIYVWHSGRYDDNRESFIRIPQNKAILDLNIKSDKQKISHASCEIEIDFSSLSSSDQIVKLTRSALIYSEEYRTIKNNIGLTPDLQQLFIEKYSNTPITSMKLYLSLYPDDSDENSSQLDIFSKRMRPLLKEKNMDFQEKGMLSLTEISLTNLKFERIISALVEILTFKISNNIVVIDEMRASNRYFLPDVFDRHFKDEDDLKLGANFACSTLITQILSAGLGENNYAQLSNEAEEILGHRNAYPEFVYTIAELARKQSELNDSPSIKNS